MPQGPISAGWCGPARSPNGRTALPQHLPIPLDDVQALVDWRLKSGRLRRVLALVRLGNGSTRVDPANPVRSGLAAAPDAHQTGPQHIGASTRTDLAAGVGIWPSNPRRGGSWGSRPPRVLLCGVLPFRKC